MIEIVIGPDQQQQRLDRFFKKYLPKASLSHIYKIIRKDVKVNGKRMKPEIMLSLGDVVHLYLTQEEVDEYAEEKSRLKTKKQFSVIYEDDNLLAVNKPKGLLTHGDHQEKKNTLVNQVIDYLVEKGDYAFSRANTFIPAPVNRLDRNTSGIVLFGKNNTALQCLNQMIKEKDSIRKLYLAVTEGELHSPITLSSSMMKDESRNMISVNDSGEGKHMETTLRPLSVRNGYTLVEAELITGRTHQIRAHLAAQKLYIIGDPKYGSGKGNAFARKKYDLTTQFLHAYKIQFHHCPPMFTYLDGLELTAALPKALERIKEEMFGEE